MRKSYEAEITFSFKPGVPDGITKAEQEKVNAYLDGTDRTVTVERVQQLLYLGQIDEKNLTAARKTTNKVAAGLVNDATQIAKVVYVRKV
jgi:hypothetical protein